MASNEELLVKVFESVQKMQEQLVDRIDVLETKIDAQAREMERFKGAIGAIMFAASCLWAAFMAFKERLLPS